MTEPLWTHLRRGSSFGPPPTRLDEERPWLKSGRPSSKLAERPARAVAPSTYEPPSALAHTESSLQRERAGGVLDRTTPSNLRRIKPEHRTGPCDERHRPLSSHAPRQLKTRQERLHPPKWQPSREWRAQNTYVGAGGGAASATPLAGPGKRVVERCTHEEDEEAQPVDPVVLRVTGGGWAADLSDRPLLPRDDDNVAWPLDHELSLWREKAAIQQRKGGRSTLALVDDFLSGSMASQFLSQPHLRLEDLEVGGGAACPSDSLGPPSSSPAEADGGASSRLARTGRAVIASNVIAGAPLGTEVD